MKIAMIGAGNLATKLGIALFEGGHEFVQVYSRSEDSAALLALQLDCAYTNDVAKVKPNADIYIISVSDSVISEVVSGLDCRDKMVVHTAGSISMDILAANCKNYGVFYPLQTFSKQRVVDFGTIPICIEANSDSNLLMLKYFAASISTDVREINSQQRQQIHLAAVFVCNFANHFFTIGEKLVEEKEMDFGILKPLILETANKAMEFSPITVQTGPAVRNNRNVMEKHLEMLKDYPEWETLYKLISNDIYKIQNNR